MMYNESSIVEFAHRHGYKVSFYHDASHMAHIGIRIDLECGGQFVNLPGSFTYAEAFRKLENWIIARSRKLSAL